MYDKRPEPAGKVHTRNARVFAALADETRLALVVRLSGGARLSIARLTEGSTLTRQAITKHLQVLQGARLVRGLKRGREVLFVLDPEPLAGARLVLADLSRQWEQALGRLKSWIETGRGPGRPGPPPPPARARAGRRGPPTAGHPRGRPKV